MAAFAQEGPDLLNSSLAPEMKDQALLALIRTYQENPSDERPVAFLRTAMAPALGALGRDYLLPEVEKGSLFSAFVEAIEIYPLDKTEKVARRLKELTRACLVAPWVAREREKRAAKKIAVALAGGAAYGDLLSDVDDQRLDLGFARRFFGLFVLLGDLREEERDLLLEHLADRRPMHEIAKSKGILPNTLSQQIRRAKGSLARAVKKAGER